MDKKAAIGISFQWIFAILIGMFILAGAIYGLTKFMGSEGALTSTKQSKAFSNLLNPLELGFEDTKSILLKVPLETRIRNYCYSDEGLGNQQLSFDQEIYNQYTDDSGRVPIDNLYLFSERYLEGKLFYAISTKFEFPFHIASPISIIPANQEYCFIESPDEIKETLEGLNQSNLILEESECDFENPKTTTVCFDEEGCNITVDTYDHSVSREYEDTVYYETNSLLIAAIFSNPEIYECQLKRLLSRTEILSKTYIQKNILYSESGSDIYVQLQNFISGINSYSSSEDLFSLIPLSEDLKTKNERMDERLW